MQHSDWPFNQRPLRSEPRLRKKRAEKVSGEFCKKFLPIHNNQKDGTIWYEDF